MTKQLGHSQRYRSENTIISGMAKLRLDIMERSGQVAERSAWGYENYLETHEESQNTPGGIRIRADLSPKLHRHRQRSEPGPANPRTDQNRQTAITRHCSKTIIPADTPESATLQTESKQNPVYQQNAKVTHRLEKQVDRDIAAAKPTP
jgi:hypothetical protein